MKRNKYMGWPNLAYKREFTSISTRKEKIREFMALNAFGFGMMIMCIKVADFGRFRIQVLWHVNQEEKERKTRH